MIHLPIVGGERQSYELERAQIIASSTGTFLRVSTKAVHIPAGYYQWIRNTANSDNARWQIDGVNCNLSCRNVEFIVAARKPQLLTSLVIDIYLPLNYAVDVNFTQYVPSYKQGDSYGGLNATPTPIHERSTAVLNASTRPERMGRHSRRTAPPSTPSQQQSLEAGTTETALFTEFAAPEPQPVVKKKKDPSYLRKFKNIDINEEL